MSKDQKTINALMLIKEFKQFLDEEREKYPNLSKYLEMGMSAALSGFKSKEGSNTDLTEEK